MGRERKRERERERERKGGERIRYMRIKREEENRTKESGNWKRSGSEKREGEREELNERLKCTQLKGFKYYYQILTIQFDISHLFVQS